MSHVVLLDAGPLGIVTNPRPTVEVRTCVQWPDRLLDNGVQVLVPEIADYEVRRELLRSNRAHGLGQLDALIVRIGYVPLNTPTMRQAAAFWALLRQQGRPTTEDAALDGDVILAAQAAILRALGEDVVIATTNVGHLARLVPAEAWQNITP